MSIKTKVILSALAAATVFYPLEEIYLPRILNAATSNVQQSINSAVDSNAIALENIIDKFHNQSDLIGEGIATLITPESAKRVMKAPTEKFIVGTPGDYGNLWSVYSQGHFPKDTEAYASFNSIVETDPRNERVMSRITDKNGFVNLGKIGGRYLKPDTLYAPH